MFHVGYFRNIINILQTICKKCARVLLDEKDKELYRVKLSNEHLSYMTKKAIHKKIIAKCKKLTKCPHCKEINGFVKKLTANKAGTANSVLKIVHEKFKDKDKESMIQAQLSMFQLNTIFLI